LNETTIQQHKKFKILLIGDACLDEYLIGDVNRLSPEAPVPVLLNPSKSEKPGMVANVRANLVALGCDAIFYSNNFSEIVKTRYIDRKSNQQLLRVDQENKIKPLKKIDEDLSNYDAVVISDYNKGYVTYELVEDIITDFQGPVFIDTKKTDLQRFEGAFLKINELEYNARTSDNSCTIVTLGEHGAMYNEHLYRSMNVEVFDVCGAGDTFLSALCYQYLETNSIEQAIEFANKASAVTIQHIGVYHPSKEEIDAIRR
jgi:bifunctional ADP-heptose synthase (sugar kinase/adenylyltransferase)